MDKERGSADFFGIFVGLIIVALIIVFAILALDSRPRSSEGVRTIDDYTAQISSGDTLVLTSVCGKNCTHTWLVTWDGESTVYADDEGLFGGSHHSGKVCGIDCTATMDMGWLTRDLNITERADHIVEVNWPWGWGYRRYQASD